MELRRIGTGYLGTKRQNSRKVVVGDGDVVVHEYKGHTFVYTYITHLYNFHAYVCTLLYVDITAILYTAY